MVVSEFEGLLEWQIGRALWTWGSPPPSELSVTGQVAAVGLEVHLVVTGLGEGLPPLEVGYWWVVVQVLVEKRWRWGRRDKGQ